MFELILNKVFYLTFFMSTLNILNHVWRVVKRLREDLPDKYELSKTELIFLGLSISFVLTTMFTGIEL